MSVTTVIAVGLLLLAADHTERPLEAVFEQQI
jgi:hypothetical protein